RSDFHSALPHNFIDPELPVAMQSILHELQQQLEETHSEFEKTVQRFRQLSDFFS
ncbi:ATPase RavA domain-containing protein, partial [Bacillus cereus group sp. Bce015]